MEDKTENVVRYTPISLVSLFSMNIPNEGYQVFIGSSKEHASKRQQMYTKF